MAATDDSAQTLSLCGTWKIHPADETGRRTVGDRALDDMAWAEVSVPGNWQDVAGFEQAESALYRRWFTLPESPTPTGRRRWLTIDGLCSQGDVWLDGAYLGDTEGYFVRHTFDITDRLGTDPDHLLAIEANCLQPDGPSLTDVFTGGGESPGGIWHDVRLEETGDVRLTNLTLLVLEADADRAIVRFRATLDSRGTHLATVTTSITRAGKVTSPGTGNDTHEQEVVLALGQNEIEWHMAVESPALWWPHKLGDQPLYDAAVAVSVQGSTSHSQRRRFGVRSVDIRRSVTSVNGERLYLNGVHWAPHPRGWVGATPQDIRRDLAVAVDVGVDLIRVHAHVAPRELYAEADRLGVLIWQDVPLQLAGGRRGRRSAVEQARKLVTQLGHHPSVARWSSPELAAPRHRPALSERNGVTWGPLWRLVRDGLRRPTWVRSSTGRAVQEALTEGDPTRLALDGQGSGLPLGSRSVVDLGQNPASSPDAVVTAARRLPHLVRFVSGWGPGPDHDGPAGKPDPAIEPWPETARRLIEGLRVLKYEPVGGHCLFNLGATPLAPLAILDADQRPTDLWRAVTEASRPVIPVAQLPSGTLSPGRYRCPMYVVSDLREPVEGLRLTIDWMAPGCHPQRWDEEVSIGPDTVIRVTRPVLQTRDPGAADLRLHLVGPGLVVTRNYTVQVSSPTDSSGRPPVGYRKGRPSP